MYAMTCVFEIIYVFVVRFCFYYLVLFSLLDLYLIFSILCNRCLALFSAYPRSSRELVLDPVSWSSSVCSIFPSLTLRDLSSGSSGGRTYGDLESHSQDASQSLPPRTSPSRYSMTTRIRASTSP